MARKSLEAKRQDSIAPVRKAWLMKGFPEELKNVFVGLAKSKGTTTPFLLEDVLLKYLQSERAPEPFTPPIPGEIKSPIPWASPHSTAAAICYHIGVGLLAGDASEKALVKRAVSKGYKKKQVTDLWEKSVKPVMVACGLCKVSKDGRITY